MLGFILFIIFGALVGWIASMLAGTNNRQGCFLNVVVGIIGSFIGTFLMTLLTGHAFSVTFSIRSFVVATLGALLFLGGLKLIRNR